MFLTWNMGLILNWPTCMWHIFIHRTGIRKTQLSSLKTINKYHTSENNWVVLICIPSSNTLKEKFLKLFVSIHFIVLQVVFSRYCCLARLVSFHIKCEIYICRYYDCGTVGLGSISFSYHPEITQCYTVFWLIFKSSAIPVF